MSQNDEGRPAAAPDNQHPAPTVPPLSAYVLLRRASVPHPRALEEAGLTEAELRKHMQRDLRLALDLMTLWGSRRRQTNAQLLYLIAAQVLGRKQRRDLAELVEHWKWS